MTDPTIKLFIEHVSVAFRHHGFNRGATEDEMFNWFKAEMGSCFNGYWGGELHYDCSRSGIVFENGKEKRKLSWKKLTKEVCAAIREEETEQIRMVF